jgi:hypothetical protein
MCSTVLGYLLILLNRSAGLIGSSEQIRREPLQVSLFTFTTSFHPHERDAR